VSGIFSHGSGSSFGSWVDWGGCGPWLWWEAPWGSYLHKRKGDKLRTNSKFPGDFNPFQPCQAKTIFESSLRWWIKTYCHLKRTIQTVWPKALNCRAVHLFVPTSATSVTPFWSGFLVSEKGLPSGDQTWQLNIAPFSSMIFPLKILH
jgi:hypothetical protein